MVAFGDLVEKHKDLIAVLLVIVGVMTAFIILTAPEESDLL